MDGAYFYPFRENYAGVILMEKQPEVQKLTRERPISDAWKDIDTDLARDNLENDLTFADLQDL